MTQPARNRQLVRQLVIVRELLTAGRDGRTLDQLTLAMGVTSRTIRRDLNALEEAHLPITVGKRDDGVTVFGLTLGAGCPLCGRARVAA